MKNRRQETMFVELNDKWVERINSPMGFVAGALAGVSITFAPLGMYFAGKAMGPSAGLPVAALCMAVILYSGFFHYKLAQAVMSKVHEAQKSAQTRIGTDDNGRQADATSHR